MLVNRYHGDQNVSPKSGGYSHIVLHYVGAGTSAAGSARDNCAYFASGYRGASAHYFVDDGGVWEYADPHVHYTWHCGDGGGRYGITNSNSIGVEVCIDGDRPYTAAEVAHLRELVPWLMAEYGIPAERVVRHYDASRKLCPLYYATRQDAWEALRREVTMAGAGWVFDGSGWWWRDADGGWPAAEWRGIDGEWYWFDSNGYMATGWRQVGADWYYLQPDGQPVGAMVHGVIKWIGDAYYAFAADGRMVTGALAIGDGGRILL